MKQRSYTVRYAIYIFISLIAFFFLMKIFGLDQYPELRMFNFVIVGFFISRLIKKNYIENSHTGYLTNLSSAFGASALAVVLSCIGLFIYLNVIDPNYINTISSSSILGNSLTATEITMAIFLEGMASSMIVAFGAMQYWKDYKRTTTTVELN